MRAFIDTANVPTIAVQRETLSQPAGTLESRFALATVTGMSSLEAVFQHQSSAWAARTMGKFSSDAFIVDVDHAQLPSGGEIRSGDRIVVASGRYAGTYLVHEARSIQDRVWNLTVIKIPESG